MTEIIISISLQVIWQNLYSTVSSRDIGTMFAARNVVNARNVSNDPSGNYYASATMADKFTTAYIVAGGLEHFGIENVAEEAKINAYSGEIGNRHQMKSYILQQARHFVEQYVCIDLDPLPEYGPISNTLKCRNCGKNYKQARGLRKHEHSVHDHADPLYDDAPQAENTSVSSSSNEDMVLNYTKLALSLGLLRLNHNDAIDMGDGARIMLVNQYLYLLYKKM